MYFGAMDCRTSFAMTKFFHVNVRAAPAPHPGWPAYRRARCRGRRCGPGPRRQSISWPAPVTSASRRCHRSTFFTGCLAAVFQPLAFQPAIHSVMPLSTYWLSTYRVTLHGRLSADRRLDHGRHFHAVVGGVQFAAKQLLLRVGRLEPVRPSHRGRDCPCRRRRCKSRLRSIVTPSCPISAKAASTASGVAVGHRHRRTGQCAGRPSRPGSAGSCRAPA